MASVSPHSQWSWEDVVQSIVQTVAAPCSSRGEAIQEPLFSETDPSRPSLHLKLAVQSLRAAGLATDNELRADILLAKGLLIHRQPA